MTVFVSHSFQNRPEFENVADALVNAGVSHWDPITTKPGMSLRDQLREAVSACNVCIFIATHQSVASPWCSAEIGAFWGTGKRVIVYVADSSLTDDQLPPHLQGDVWERRISKIVANAKEFDVAADDTVLPAPSASLTSLTVAQLERVVGAAISLGRAAEKATEPGNAPDTQSTVKDATSRVLRGIEATDALEQTSSAWRRHLLWVDDRPDNNIHERATLEALGFSFSLALSTREALDLLANQHYGAVISDMGRVEGRREGYVLLEGLRARDPVTPFFIYAGSGSTAHRQEAAAKGAQGVTNRPDELLDMIVGFLGGVQ